MSTSVFGPLVVFEPDNSELYIFWHKSKQKMSEKIKKKCLQFVIYFEKSGNIV